MAKRRIDAMSTYGKMGIKNKIRNNSDCKRMKPIAYFLNPRLANTRSTISVIRA
jgi:hypothetical protein